VKVTEKQLAACLVGGLLDVNVMKLSIFKLQNWQAELKAVLKKKGVEFGTDMNELKSFMTDNSEYVSINGFGQVKLRNKPALLEQIRPLLDSVPEDVWCLVAMFVKEKVGNDDAGV
jgi:hypothetical protein